MRVIDIIGKILTILIVLTIISCIILWFNGYLIFDKLNIPYYNMNNYSYTIYYTFFSAIAIFYILLVITLVDIVKKGARGGWVTLNIISFFLLPIGMLFLIVYWFAGASRIQEKSYLDKAKINVHVSGSIHDIDRKIKDSIFCSECGASLKKNSKFCLECGVKC